MSGEPVRQPRTRAQTLCVRVHWLDRRRHAVALATAALVLLIVRFGAVLGAGWPEMQATGLSVIVGIIVWWVVELGLIYVTAVWEAEHDRLVREGGLPRAVLRPPRDRR